MSGGVLDTEKRVTGGMNPTGPSLPPPTLELRVGRTGASGQAGKSELGLGP